MKHTPFLVAAAFATALMGHTGLLPDFSGLETVPAETTGLGEDVTADTDALLADPEAPAARME